ncbi:MAG: hypothetical protein A2147_05625 [Chloroflexi bacterium RBG_16_57_8]|nr:MAG: hypothetical protein A2147_05625 [Chloroflexi bacterium RBG_16_57_8]
MKTNSIAGALAAGGLIAAFLGFGYGTADGGPYGEDSSGVAAEDRLSVGRRATDAPVADSSRPLEIAWTPLLPRDDPFLRRQWALEQIGVPVVGVTGGGANVVIAILDTGIDRDHEDLAGTIAGEINLTDSPTARDLNGHGTHVAGIIAAGTGNGIGVAGIAPKARLLNVKVADDYGLCHPATVARGIIWAVDNGAMVINISLEFRGPAAVLEDAVDYAWTRGVLVIAAAGNDAGDTPVYPAYYPNVIAVSATGRADELAPLSNHGDWVDFAAPGLSIYSTLPGSRYGYETGTSFAAACVSGLAALAFSAVSDLNGDGRLNDEVRAAIEGSARKIEAPGTGHGLIDASALFAAIP